MAMTTQQEKSQARKAATLRIALAIEEACRVVASGKCPDCGRPLRRNLALAGWFQCSQFGADGFRANSSLPSCSFQCFTE